MLAALPRVRVWHIDFGNCWFNMQLSVKLFARAKDLAGAGQVMLELPAPATVADVRVALTRVYPLLAPLASSLLIAVGTDYAGDQQVVTSDSDVACFPPVSGG